MTTTEIFVLVLITACLTAFIVVLCVYWKPWKKSSSSPSSSIAATTIAPATSGTSTIDISISSSGFFQGFGSDCNFGTTSGNLFGSIVYTPSSSNSGNTISLPSDGIANSTTGLYLSLVNEDTVNSKTVDFLFGSTTNSTTISPNSYQLWNCVRSADITSFQNYYSGTITSGTQDTSVNETISIVNGYFANSTGASPNNCTGYNGQTVAFTSGTSNIGNSVSISYDAAINQTCDLYLYVVNQDPVNPKTYSYTFSPGSNDLSGSRTLAPGMMDLWTCPTNKTINNFSCQTGFQPEIVMSYSP